MYHGEGVKYAKWILEQLLSKREIDGALADNVYKIFQNSREGFNELVHKKSIQSNRVVSSELLYECTFIALKEIVDKQSSQSSPFSTPSLGSYTPNTGGWNLNFNKQDEGLNHQKVKAGAAEIFLTSPAPVVEPPKPVDTIKPVNSFQTDGKEEVNVKVIKTVDKRDEMSTDQKLCVRISGATKEKNEKGVISITRDLLVVTKKNGEGENLIKHDLLNITGSKVMFDSPRDMIEFLNGQMSKEDITSPYYRMVFYHTLKQIKIEHDLFFREFGNMENLLASEGVKACSLDKSPDLFENLEKYNLCFEVLKRLDPDFRTAFNQFILDEINYQLVKYIRFGNNLTRKIRFSDPTNMEDFIKDQKYAPLRKILDFERIVNRIVVDTINIMLGDGTDMVFCHIDSDNCHAYTNTRKYMTLSPESNGLCSLNYWSYNPVEKEIMKNAMKENVLVCMPQTDVITNIYNPEFLRQIMFTMSEAPKLIPKNINPHQYENVIYLLLSRHLAEEKRLVSLPDKFIYTYDDNIKMFNVNATLDRELLLD